MEARGLGSSPICWLIDWQLTSSDLPLSLSLVAVYTADGQGKTPRGNEEREREKRGRLECSMATACRNVFPFLNKSRGTYIYIYRCILFISIDSMDRRVVCAPVPVVRRRWSVRNGTLGPSLYITSAFVRRSLSPAALLLLFLFRLFISPFNQSISDPIFSIGACTFVFSFFFVF